MTLESMITRFRRIAETVVDLSEILLTLKAESAQLEGDIIAELSADTSLYNVSQYKTSSSGLIGRQLFTVAFGEQLEETTKRTGKEEQSWLRDLATLETGANYVAGSLKLLKSKIQSDLRNGKLTATQLKALGLKLSTTAKLTVRQLRSDTEVAEAIEEARTLADSVEEQ